MNWESMNIAISPQKVGQPVLINFKYIGENPEQILPQNIKPGCHCSGVRWNPATRILAVTYLPGPIPVHLAANGKKGYDSTKHIFINYAGRQDQLTFTCRVNP